ncbi:MAG: SGNH/GDSL hydrolase family protein [Planctomycetota bacterium]
MAGAPQKALIALGSAGLAALVGLQLLPDEAPEVDTVELVDSGAEIEEIFAERDAELAAEAGRMSLSDGGIGAGPGPGADGAVAEPPALPRVMVREKAASKLFPSIGSGQIYDPHLLSRHKPSVIWRRVLEEHPSGGWRMRTNTLGLREDTEVATEQPDLRILVVGDSHVDGVCDNVDAFPNVLERLLAERHPGLGVESLNGGTGGWSFYNYLGALEGFRHLAPDVFVVTVYGGNDFYGALDLHHYHRGEKRPRRERRTVGTLVRLSKENMGIPSQYYSQVAYFHDHPDEEPAARQMARDVVLEIARQCEEMGTALLCVYLPPMAHGQPERFEAALELAQSYLPVSDEELEVDERLADAWLADLEEAGIRAVDLRPAFRAAAEPLYWDTDHHISLDGQQRVAEEILAAVEELAGLRR